MQAKINKTNLPKFKAGERRYDVRDTDLLGFILTVHPTGRRVYYCEYQRGKRVKLGVEGGKPGRCHGHQALRVSAR